MAEQPNILFFFTDQMRGDCLSAAGHPVVRTPNLDHLAARGMLFSRAYSPCPSCIAARASLMTGLSPSSTGRLGYQDQVPWRYDLMLPEVLGAAGYQTHCAGKTHFYPQRAHLGFQSLDSYEAMQNFDGRYVNDYHEWLRDRTGGTRHERDHGLDSNSWNARPSPLPEELHNTTWVATKGIEFLRRRDRTRPFFLNLSFHRPHPPIDPPQAWWDRYADVELPPVPVGDWAAVHDTPARELAAWHGRLPDDVLADCRRGYYAQIAHIDNQVGRVLQALRQLRAGPTWVVFSSDHGEMLGDHHLFRKVYAYEGSARVPLIVTPPDGSGPGDICDLPCTLTDLYPTMLSMAAADIPERTEGLDLLGCLRGEAEELRRRRPWIHGEHAPCYDPDLGMQFVTDGRWKFVWYTSTGQEQLFHVAEDGDELHDRAGDPDCRDQLGISRGQLVSALAGREQDGLTDGERLIPGTRLPAVRLELMEKYTS